MREITLNKFVIFLFFFAPFFSLLIYNMINNKFIVLLPQLFREFLVTGIVVLYFFHKGFWRKYYILGFLILFIFFYILIEFLFYYNIYINIGFLEFLKGVLNNLRRFLFIFVVLIYFLYILKSRYINYYLNLLIKYLYIFWIFGILTYFLPVDFWYLLKLNYYWAEIMNQVAGNGANYIRSFEQSGKMFTHDTFYLFGFKAKRLISFYLEPTTTASLAIASTFLAYLLRKKLLLILSIIGGLLTFSKGYIIFLIVLFLYHLFFLVNKKLLKFYIYFLFSVLFISLFILYFLYLSYPFLFNYGFFAHLKGLYNYFYNFNFFGYGIGLSGSFSIIDNPYEIGIESSLANILAQLGVIGGVIIFLYFKYIGKFYCNNYLFLLLLFFYLFLYATSNSATGYSGNFLIIFIFAYFMKLYKIRRV